MGQVLKARAKLYVKRWVRDVVHQTLAPFVDLNARIALLALVVSVVYLGPKLSADAVVSTKIQALQTAWLMLLSLPIFLGLNALCAIFRTRREEQAAGTWFGDRFVYHQPQLVHTALVSAKDNDQPSRFAIPDAPRHAFIWYQIETDPSDGRAMVELAWPSGDRAIETGRPRNSPVGGFRLPTCRRMTLLTHLAAEATMTTVRVRITAWAIGDNPAT